MLVERLKFGRIAWAMTPQVMVFVVVAVIAVVFDILTHHPETWDMERPGWLSDVVIWLSWHDEGVPFSAISTLGSALAIFLSFRNSSAYNRWWEARKIWGALVNDSRSWCRQALAWVEAPADSPSDDEARDRLCRALVHRHLAFVHGLRHHLRKEDALLPKVGEFVGEEELDHYKKVPNVPTALLIKQGKEVAEARARGQIDHFRHLRMDDLLTRMSDIQGKCERIKNTPVPRQYDDIPRWFVHFYGFVLPFGLVGSLGWLTVPLVAGIMFLFMLLEGAGRVIEDPFENEAMDTPMTALSITIERDLRAALGEPLPAAARAVDGIMM